MTSIIEDFPKKSRTFKPVRQKRKFLNLQTTSESPSKMTTKKNFGNVFKLTLNDRKSIITRAKNKIKNEFSRMNN